MISWNLLLSGKTLSEQAYAVLNKIVGHSCEKTDVQERKNAGCDEPAVAVSE